MQNFKNGKSKVNAPMRERYREKIADCLADYCLKDIVGNNSGSFLEFIDGYWLERDPNRDDGICITSEKNVMYIDYWTIKQMPATVKKPISVKFQEERISGILEEEVLMIIEYHLASMNGKLKIQLENFIKNYKILNK